MKTLRSHSLTAASAPTRGAVGKGCAIAAAVGVLLLMLMGGCVATSFNGMVAKEEGVHAAWAEVENQFTRRYELIPQLVETVKGVADFEKEVLTDVTEARASVGQIKISGSELPDPAQLEQFMAAQSGLGSALSRLLAVSENYPTLKASTSFQDLQSQLEGTQNRVTVARRDFIDATKTYNTAIRTFPRNILAPMFNFEKMPQFEAEEPAFENPTIDFGD